MAAMGGGIYGKSKSQAMHHAMAGSSTKQLKSLNLSKRGLEPKKKISKKKKKKDKIKKVQAIRQMRMKLEA